MSSIGRTAAHGTRSPKISSHSSAVRDGERGADFRHEFGGVLGAAAHRDAARVARQLRAADQLAQRGEEMVRVHRDIERALFCRMDAGQPAGAGIAGHVAPLALGPDKTAGLDRQRAAQQ